MRELTQAERDALGQPNPVDITTTGRRSRQPRRIEIWADRRPDIYYKLSGKTKLVRQHAGTARYRPAC